MARRASPRYLVAVLVAFALYALHWFVDSYRRGSRFAPSSRLALLRDLDFPKFNGGAADEDDGLVVDGKTRPFELAQDHFVTLDPGVFESRVHPAVANSTRLYFDVCFLLAHAIFESPRSHAPSLHEVAQVEFHRLRDKYGLIDVTFTEDELLAMFKRVIAIWARANIHMRIWIPQALEFNDLSAGKAEAYRLLVTGSKEKDESMNRQRKQLAASEFGVERTQWMYREILNKKNPKCCEVERHLTGADERDTWSTRNVVSVYAVHYFRWYNAVSLGSFIVIRGGSWCVGPPAAPRAHDVTTLTTRLVGASKTKCSTVRRFIAAWDTWIGTAPGSTRWARARGNKCPLPRTISLASWRTRLAIFSAWVTRTTASATLTRRWSKAC